MSQVTFYCLYMYNSLKSLGLLFEAVTVNAQRRGSPEFPGAGASLAQRALTPKCNHWLSNGLLDIKHCTLEISFSNSSGINVLTMLLGQ